MIKTTDNYSMFRYMDGNRTINERTVKDIMSSIRTYGYLKSKPIEITPSHEVIDGQHRLEACKRLSMPIPYIVVDDDWNIQKVQRVNSVGHKWTLKDYIDSYVQMRDPSYLRLANLISEFSPWMSVSFISETCMGGMTVIREAKAKLSENDYEYYRGLFSWIEKFKPILSTVAGSAKSWQRALAFCYRWEPLDNDTLYRKVLSQADKLITASDIPSALRQIEDIYNWHTKTDQTISGLARAKKTMDADRRGSYE